MQAGRYEVRGIHVAGIARCILHRSFALGFDASHEEDKAEPSSTNAKYHLEARNSVDMSRLELLFRNYLRKGPE